MDTENIKVRKLSKTKSELLTSDRFLQKMFVFSNDTNEIGIKTILDEIVWITNQIGWTRDTGVLTPDYDDVLMFNCDYLTFFEDAQDWEYYNFVQFGFADEYKYTIYQNKYNNTRGILSNGAYFDGVNWVNGDNTQYSYNLSYNNGLYIKSSTANTANANITWENNYYFGYYDCIIDTTTFLIKDTSANTIINADNTGVTIGDTRGSYPIEFSNLNNSSKIKFITDSIVYNDGVDEGLYITGSSSLLKVHFKVGSQLYQRYITCASRYWP